MSIRIILTAVFLLGIQSLMPLTAAEVKHKPITLLLQKVLKVHPDVKKMLEESIALARKENPDKKTNPVMNLQKYFTYIDQASELIPRQRLDKPEGLTRDQILQSICYFYFLVDQPLSQLEGKGLYKNSIQYYPPFADWLHKFAKTWGSFLDTDKSWSRETYMQFLNDPRFGLKKHWYESPSKWHTFNQFFSRHLISPSVRPIASPADLSVVSAPTDSVPQGVWDIDYNSKIKVDKGLKVKLATFFSVKDLLAEDSLYKDAFAGGVLTHTFLDVNDYHRFHFPVSGTVREMKIISQNVSLEVSWDNEGKRYVPVDSTGWQFSQTRGYVIVDTEKYGLVALIPVGMAQVSSVNFEKNIEVGQSYKKGEPLGYFLFGGSDFIMLFQDVARFELTAPHADSTGFKHILMGEQYGKMKGDRNFIDDYNKVLALDEFAESLHLPPLSAIDKSVTLEQVDMMIYKEINSSGMPAFDEKKVREEAEKKYPLWNIGDKVVAIDAQGYKHEGKLEDKGTRYITIGGSKIYAVDVSQSMLTHLYEENRNAAIDSYIKARKKIYYQKRRTYKETLREEVKNKYYSKYSLVFYHNKWWDYAHYRVLLERGKEKYDQKRALLKAAEDAQKKENEESSKGSGGK